MRTKTIELQYLETLAKRTTLTSTEINRSNALTLGFEGELLLDQALIKTGLQSNTILSDITLNYKNNVTQIDQIFSIGKTLYINDAKNYQGSYSFQEKTWIRNGKTIPHNIFGQIDRARDILTCILEDNKLIHPIDTTIVFTSPFVNLDIKDPVDHTVKKVGAFSDHVSWLVHQNTDPNDIRWQNIIRQYQIPSYQPDTDFSAQTNRKLQQGIRCLRCDSFNWLPERYCLICKNCGAKEVKEEAYVRTICDYGVLFFKHDLRLHDLYNFFGDDYSKRYIREMLSKHFTSKFSTENLRTYVNKGQNFRYWFTDQATFFEKLQERKNWH